MSSLRESLHFAPTLWVRAFIQNFSYFLSPYIRAILPAN